MEPYQYEDAGVVLKIGPSLGGAARLRITDTDDQTLYAEVRPQAVPGAALALYEAAGLPAPLILPRPEQTPLLFFRGDIFTGRLTSKVTVGLRGIQPEELDPDAALELAAHIAVNAEAVKRDREPDPDEVNRLATVIHRRVQCNTSPDPCGGCLEVARLVLLGGWKREPGE